MALQWTPYLVPLILAIAALIVLALYILRRRSHETRARTGAVLLLAGAVWMLFYAVELSSTALHAKVLWSKMQYWGIVLVPVAWWIYALQYTGREKWLTYRNLAPLGIAALVTIFVVFTNEAHGLIWRNTELVSDGSYLMLKKTYGVGFWIFFVCAYALLLLGAYVLIQAFARSHELYRRQINALFLAISLLALASTLGRFGATPFPNLQLEPFAFGVIALVITWGLFRLRLGDIVPVARDAVIESMQDGVIVLDRENRIVDVNAAAQQVIGPTASTIIGRSIIRLLADHPELIARFYDVLDSQTEIVLLDGDVQRHFDVRISPVRDRHNRPTGRLIVFREITDRVHAENAFREAEAEVQRKLREQAALRDATTLISSTLDLSTVLHHIAEQMCRLVHGTSAYVCSWEAHTQRSQILAEYIGPLACKKEQVSDRGVTCDEVNDEFVEAISAGEPWIVQVDDPGRPESDQRVPEQYGAQTVLYVPLFIRSQVVAFAELWESRCRREFTAIEIALCQAIAQNAAIAIENARLYEQAQKELFERVQAEDALRKLNHDLENRIAKRTAELTRMNAQLTRENEERAQTEAMLLQRNRELLSLQSAAAATVSSLDLAFVLETVTWEMVSLLQVEDCTIREWNQEDGVLSLIAAYDASSQWQVSPAAKQIDLTDYPAKAQVLTERYAQQFTIGQSNIDTTETAYMQATNVKSLLMLPMIFQARVVGLVEITDGRLERTFTDHEISLAQLLSNQAASAIENARLYSETQKRLREQTALREAGAVISSALDSQTVLTRIAEQMGQAIDATSAYICGFDAETVTSTVLAEYVGPEARSKRASDLSISYLDADDDEFLRKLQAGQHDISDVDDPGLSKAERAHLDQYGANTILYIPLLVKNRLIGYAELWESRRRREFPPQEISLCHGIAQQAAIALENAQLYEKARQEIAERKRAEEQIQASLKEKEALLQEIHHRVKNNLQIVSSLLSLQARSIQDDHTLQMFQESQNRILSMALIHEKLYRAEDLARIDLAEYIRNLAADLMHSYTAHSGPVTLEINASDVFLTIEKAVPCGLIVNELISNALKHAFCANAGHATNGRNGREGEIRIDLSSDLDNNVTLVVGDNGAGFPENLDFRTTESLGLRLVNTLASQLEGTIELNNNDGAEFKLTFTTSQAR